MTPRSFVRATAEELSRIAREQARLEEELLRAVREGGLGLPPPRPPEPTPPFGTLVPGRAEATTVHVRRNRERDDALHLQRAARTLVPRSRSARAV